MTFRSDYNNSVNLNSNYSTSRLINENETTTKYNQFKRNVNAVKSQDYSNYNNFYSGASYNNEGSSNYLQGSTSSQQLVPDRDYSDDKFNHLKKMFDERLNNVYQELRLTIQKLSNDEILNTMKKDAISNEYISQRMAEIIDETLHYEKEQTIKNLNEELAEAKSKINVLDKARADLANKLQNINDDYKLKMEDYEERIREYERNQELMSNDFSNVHNSMQHLGMKYDEEIKRMADSCNIQVMKQSNEVSKYKHEISNLNSQIQKYQESLKEICQENEENKLEMERLQKVVAVIEIDLHGTENKLNEKKSKLESTQQEMSNLQTSHFETSLKLKKLNEENRSLRSQLDNYEKERRDFLDKYSSFNDDFQKSQNEKIESIEKQHKEKNTVLKKKILELKSTITTLEDQIKEEKSQFLNIKVEYSKVITKMQEDMTSIRNGWEKKCIEQKSEFKEAVVNLEKRHEMELSNMSRDHQIEIDKLIRESNKFKQDSELLKNFDKEFIRMTKHNELIDEEVSELKKKHQVEIKALREEVDNELARRLSKLDIDKKSEYEYLTENIRKNLKNLEKSNEELKNTCLELENKLKNARETNDNLMEQLEVKIRNVKNLSNKLEEKESTIESLSNKLASEEERNKTLNNSYKSLSGNYESLLSKSNLLEKEKFNLSEDAKTKEEYYKIEMEKNEKTFETLIRTEIEKSEKEIDAHSHTKRRLNELELQHDKLELDYKLLNKKNIELNNKISGLEEFLETLKSKVRAYEADYSEIEKKCFEMEKNYKKVSYEKTSTYHTLIKIFKSKLNAMRTEITSIKNFSKAEISLMKKESDSIIEGLLNRLKLFNMNFEKDLDISIRKHKESLENEFIKRLEQKDHENREEITKINKKFEKHLMEEYRNNEKLEKEKNLASETISSLNLKINELTYKIREQELENKNLSNQINKTKLENETLIDTLDKYRSDRLALNRNKQESEETLESNKREQNKQYHQSLTNILGTLVKTKNKYHQELLKLKVDVESLNIHFENELSSVTMHYKNLVDKLQNALDEEKSLNKKIKPELDSKTTENYIFKAELDKLKEFYENKIEILNNKIATDKERIQELKIDIKSKNEQLKEVSTIIQDQKATVKNLKRQLELKIDEVDNNKKEYENLLIGKEKKINDLQNIMNEAKQNFTTGISNLKKNTQLNNDMMMIMKKMKTEEPEDEISYKSAEKIEKHLRGNAVEKQLERDIKTNYRENASINDNTYYDGISKGNYNNNYGKKK